MRILAGKRNDRPQPGIAAEFDAACRMPLGIPRKPIYRRAPTHIGAERSQLPGRQEALAGAIHCPLAFMRRLPAEHGRHQGQRDEARTFPARPGGAHLGDGRPDAARRHDESGLALKRETGTEAHDRPFGVARGGIQPRIAHAQRGHGGRHRGEQRIAVIDRIDAIARARIRSRTPGAGGTELDDQTCTHARVHHSSRRNEKAASWKPVCKAARSTPAPRSFCAAPDA